MLLDSDDRFLGCIVATAIATNSIVSTVEFEDTLQEKVTPGQQFAALIAATAQILAAPARNTARRIKEIHIYNADTVTHDVTVFIGIGLTQNTLKKSLALAANKTLHWNPYNGWAVV